MEPFPGADPGGVSLRGHVHAGPKGVGRGNAIRDAHLQLQQVTGLPWSPSFPPEPFPRVELGRRPLRDGRTPVRREWCARQDLNLRCPRSQRGLSAAGVRARGAAGVEPARPSHPDGGDGRNRTGCVNAGKARPLPLAVIPTGRLPRGRFGLRFMMLTLMDVSIIKPVREARRDGRS